MTPHFNKSFATMKSWLRRLVLILVWAFLVYWVIKAFQRSYRNDTTFTSSTKKDSFVWPTFNICPLYVGQRDDASKSFEDALVEINRTKASLNANIATAEIRADENRWVHSACYLCKN